MRESRFYDEPYWWANHDIRSLGIEELKELSVMVYTDHYNCHCPSQFPYLYNRIRSCRAALKEHGLALVENFTPNSRWAGKITPISEEDRLPFQSFMEQF